MLNISIFRARLIDKLKNVNNKKLRKIMAKMIYTIKYKYKYMDNLPASFINLILILEDNDYKIDYKDYKIGLNITFKNVIYINNKDYEINLSIDKVSWTCNIKLNDINKKYGFDYTIDLHDSIKLNSLLSEYESILYNLLDDIFSNLFLEYVQNI